MSPTLLPWLLIVILDHGLMTVTTSLRFDTEEHCQTIGQELVLRMMLDLPLTNHHVDYECHKNVDVYPLTK